MIVPIIRVLEQPYASGAYQVRTKAKKEGTADTGSPVRDVMAEKNDKPCMMEEIE